MTIPNLMLWILPYQRGVQIQHWLFSKSWVQRIFFSRQVALLKEISALMGDEANDLDDTIVCSLMSNTWKKWRIAAFRKLDSSAWGIIKGRVHLSEAQMKGKGVILVTTHSLRTNLLRSILHSHSLEDIFFVHKFYESSDRAHMITAYARQLADALKVLRAGGVLGIAGDGTMGEGGFQLPFFGRLLTFRSGFADMSLRSGSPILPVYEYLQSDGRVVLEFGSPLLPGDGKRENQLEAILQQYVRSLTNHWPKLIPSLSWFKLRQFLINPATMKESESSKTPDV
jgi:lauroyl/myristoyl acyltransferase